MTISSAIVMKLRYRAYSYWKGLNGTNYLHLLLTIKEKLPTTRTPSVKDLIEKIVTGNLVITHTNVRSAFLRIMGQRIVRKK